MGIELVRKPSETPNIVNHDDYRMFRYATGGYNGVNSKYANKCAYEIEGSNFKIKSGEIILDGTQSKIDGTGETITVANISGTQYYSVYLEVDLSIIDEQKAEIKSSYDTVDYPVIDTGDDLTELQTGVARLELYRFTTSSGVISNVAQSFSLIEVGNVLHAENADLATNATNATNDEDSNRIKTTYVKNSAFNNANQTAFGDYIVEKKKLLWSGTATASAGETQTVTLSENIANGDLIEIIVNNGLNIEPFKFICKNVANAGLIAAVHSVNRNYTIADGELLYNHSADISIPAVNSIKFTCTKLSAFFVPSAISTNVTTYGSDIQIDDNFTITKVYKIIE